MNCPGAATISYEKTVSIDDVVAEANIMWAEVRSNRKGRADELYATLWEKHPQFCQSYAIVARYMCQMRCYSQKAFRLWLGKIQRNPWTGIGEYLDAGADYTVILRKMLRPRTTQKELQELRAVTRASLQYEYDDFVKKVEAHRDDIQSQEAANYRQNVEELLDCIKGRVEGFTVETDIEGSGLLAEPGSQEYVEPLGVRADGLLE